MIYCPYIGGNIQLGQPFWNLFNRLDGCAREGLAVLFYGGSWRWRVWHPASMTANIHQRRRQRIRRGTTSRRIWYGGHHGAPSAPFSPDDDGSAYGYHTELTARIMAGASAQRYGIRTGRRAKLQNIQTTATIYGQYVGGSWRWRTSWTAAHTGIIQQRQRIQTWRELQADMVRRTSWRAVAPFRPDDDNDNHIRPGGGHHGAPSAQWYAIRTAAHTGIIQY